MGARFVEPPSGDFHLRNDSPLIDAGDPASLPSYDDLDLGPADLDGDGDGIARRDVGAYEAPAAPLKVVQQPMPAQGDAGQPDPAATPPQQGADTQAPILSRLARVRSRLRYTLSEAASVTITIQRRVVVRGHKRWRTAGKLTRVSRAGLGSVRVETLIRKRGSYRVLARAIDAAGNRSPVKRLAFRVVPR
jgi:hypothetical protein